MQAGEHLEQLPALLDARHLAAELGVTRAAAEAVMRRLPKIEFEGLQIFPAIRVATRRLQSHVGPSPQDSKITRRRRI